MPKSSATIAGEGIYTVFPNDSNITVYIAWRSSKPLRLSGGERFTTKVERMTMFAVIMKGTLNRTGQSQAALNAEDAVRKIADFDNASNGTSYAVEPAVFI